MSTKQRVLVPLDGSKLAEAALPYAESIAGALGWKPCLLAVAEPAVGGIFTLDQQIQQRLEHEHCKELTAYLATVARERREQGIEVETETVAGDPTAEILAAADRAAAGMIVMATHGRGGVQRLFLGSVADKVMQGANLPTLLVSATDHPAEPSPQPVVLRRIAVPLDGSALAEAALELAGTLAAAAGAQIVLVRVQPWPLTSTMVYSYIPDLGAVEAELERQAQQYLDSVRSRLPAGIPIGIAVLRGVPATALADYVREQAIDLVLMATHGQGGFHRLLVGSTADRLVRLGLPVLLIRSAEKTAGVPARG